MSDWQRYLSLAGLLLFAVVLVSYGRHLRRIRYPGLGSAATHDSDSEAEAAEAAVTRRRMAASVLGWLLVAILVVTTAAAGLLWFLGWPRFPKSGSFDVPQMLDLFKIALSVVAGFGGVVLLAVNYRKQRVAEDDHDLDVDRAAREVVQRFNERLSSAAEQLAHNSPAVRLTGVYALAGLADDWDDKRQVCVDVLCGYLRVSRDADKPGEAEVRKAVLRTIRERVAETARPSWRSLDFDFTGLVFDNADFAGLSFKGAVIFDNAEFGGDETSFARTSFKGRLSCQGTRFTAARTNFDDVVFEGADVEFLGAEFTGHELSWVRATIMKPKVTFYRCRIGCESLDFGRMSIQSGELSFVGLDFVDAHVNFANLDDGWGDESDFPRLVFDDSRFTRCRLRLELWSELWRDRERMVWLQSCVLDTVTVEVAADEDAKPWLNIRKVELRGGTEIPDRFVRRHGAPASSAPRPGTPAPEA
ncbi:hypothetical protein PV458_17900 [Streptomyces sp. MN03-5084-2B]|nr:hypothetical protein [Streptomyces sp. MN03-5084-2B]